MKIPDVLQRKKNDDGDEESRPEPADSASTPTSDPVSTELADATRIILRSAGTAKEGPNTVETIVDAPYLDEKKISSYMREKYPADFWSAKVSRPNQKHHRIPIC